MTKTKSPELCPGFSQKQYARLPVYAREAIESLIRQRDTAVEKSRQLADTQTPSNIWVEDYGAEKGHEREYVQGDSVVFAFANVCLRVAAYRDNIELSWSEGDAPFGTGEVAFIPTSHQQARLVACEKMYSGRNDELRAAAAKKSKQAKQRKQQQRAAVNQSKDS
jgi:hypothetical protein